MVSRPLPTLSPLVRFALLAGVLYLLWFVGYKHYLAPDDRLDSALTQNLAFMSGALLRLLGYAITVSDASMPVLSLGGQELLSIWHPCNGLVLYFLFSSFILAFPGPGRNKLWFIPLGIFLIYWLNVLRIVALCLNAYYSQQTVDFNHHYTFTFLVYLFIFALWMWWATRLSKLTEFPSLLSRGSLPQSTSLFGAYPSQLATGLGLGLLLLGVTMYDEQLYALLAAGWQRGLGAVGLAAAPQPGGSVWQLLHEGQIPPAVLLFSLLYVGLCLGLFFLLVPARASRRLVLLFYGGAGLLTLGLLLSSALGGGATATILASQLLRFVVSPLPVIMFAPLLRWSASQKVASA